jgi:hypothetical protein
MHGWSAKLVYCAILMTLMMAVAMPHHSVSVYTAEVVETAPSTESRLAKAIHARIAIEATGGLPASRLSQLAAEEEGLRQLAFAADAASAREQLIDCLADELSAAMLQRATKADADHEKMTEVVRALTAAINAEVRGISA